MNGNTDKKAVVLLSGGLDSTTALAVAKSRGFECYALTVKYGQLHEVQFIAPLEPRLANLMLLRMVGHT